MKYAKKKHPGRKGRHYASTMGSTTSGSEKRVNATTKRSGKRMVVRSRSYKGTK